MKFYFSVLAITVSVSSSAVYATSADFEAKVTVQNAVVLTKDTDLSFGIIRAVADKTGTEQAKLTVNPNPDSTPVSIRENPTSENAIISIIEDGEAASFTVSDVVPNSLLVITSPDDGAIESDDGQGVGEPDFRISDWKFFITSGENQGSLYTSTTPNLKADSDGSVSFSLGATLYTSSNISTVNYPDGDYSGNFQVEVSY